MTKAGHMIKVEVTIGICRTLEVGTTSEMTGIEINITEVIKETVRIGKDHIHRQKQR